MLIFIRRGRYVPPQVMYIVYIMGMAVKRNPDQNMLDIYVVIWDDI